MINYIVIPGTDIRLYNGTVIALNAYPGVNWVVHFGWCIYDDVPYNGWYCISVPDDNIIALSDEVLVTAKVVAPAPRPCPPGPIPPPIPHNHNNRLVDPAFITVQTLVDRDQLTVCGCYVPNGKIVRVNDTGGGQAQYYIWDAETSSWKDFEFGGELVSISTEEIDSIVNTGEVAPDRHILDNVGLEYFYTLISSQLDDVRTQLAELHQLVTERL